MQPLKPGKDNTYVISPYNDIQDQGWYSVSYHDYNNMILLHTRNRF